MASQKEGRQKAFVTLGGHFVTNTPAKKACTCGKCSPKAQTALQAVQERERAAAAREAAQKAETRRLMLENVARWRRDNPIEAAAVDLRVENELAKLRAELDAMRGGRFQAVNILGDGPSVLDTRR